MSVEQEAEVLARMQRAKAALLDTGELFTRGEAGRTPSRSDRFKQAREEVHKAEQARNRLLVEIVGDAHVVPVELAQRLGLTAREAVNIVDTARIGSLKMKEYLLGQ
ncbi:hypothetical protein IU486_11750 [Streptomyces gardneri]|uniref:hypothetical protein n=1 Tax=Nocardia TaxID=1817 RepID=UPI0013573951|nr:MULTISPECIES: hypothetical protein [Nocardia]MBF6165444.1 hypothetical protein [Streptomyces gardneri]MBF6206000.1 hypothetical protein [Streptomyces gardneri]